MFGLIFRTAFILLAVVMVTQAPVLAHDYTVGSLKIGHPWARATPKGANVAGGYLTIVNTGQMPDRFIGGSADGAKRIEVHQMRMEKGVMTMREQNQGLEIKPGETITLKPNGYHLMFVGLDKPFMPGEHVNATLKFEKAGTVDVYFDVGPIGAPGPTHDGHDKMPGMSDHPKQ